MFASLTFLYIVMCINLLFVFVSACIHDIITGFGILVQDISSVKTFI